MSNSVSKLGKFYYTITSVSYKNATFKHKSSTCKSR